MGVCFSAHLSVHLDVCLSVCVFIHLSLCSYIHHYIHAYLRVLVSFLPCQFAQILTLLDYLGLPCCMHYCGQTTWLFRHAKMDMLVIIPSRMAPLGLSSVPLLEVIFSSCSYSGCFSCSVFLIMSQFMMTTTTPPVTLVCSGAFLITTVVTSTPHFFRPDNIRSVDVVLPPQLIPRDTLRGSALLICVPQHS